MHDCVFLEAIDDEKAKEILLVVYCQVFHQH